MLVKTQGKLDKIVNIMLVPIKKGPNLRRAVQDHACKHIKGVPIFVHVRALNCQVGKVRRVLLDHESRSEGVYLLSV